MYFLHWTDFLRPFRYAFAFAAAAGLFAQQNELLPPTLRGGAIPPTAGMPTNSIPLTATNFVAGAYVTNGILVTTSSNNVPPTSILGTNITIRPITLEDAIEMALQNNYDVLVARYNPDIAQFTLSGSYSVYEPSVGLSYIHSFRSQPGNVDPNTGLILPNQETTTEAFNGNLAPGVSGYLPTGTRYGVNTALSGSEVNPSLGIPFNNYFGSTLISLQQPLLRDFWIDQPRATIMINKKKLKISEWQLRQQLITTVAAVENAYYDLIRARENIKVQRAALEYNNQLLRENKKRVEVGAMAPLDEKQAEAEVARGVATLLQTEQVYAVALNNMKNLITQDFANWVNIVVDPVETLVAVPASPQLAESWKQGLTMRPEIIQAKLDLEARDINIKYLKNQIWPAVDLVGTWGENGSSLRSYGVVIDQISGDKNPQYSAGLTVSIPLGAIAPRNNYKSAKASKAQALLQYKQLEQNIMMQIDNAIKLLQSQFQQVEAARQARLFAQDALAAEQKKYENGKSTSFLVLQAQRDLTTSRFDEISALADYNKALSGLAQQEGATLSRYNLNVSVTPNSQQP
ncbi:MAG TPA: TolC family protein [Verrucomicrobiae bacterium]|jgi:outer membrane protein TolC|nr:TolC family protein [Verrucomicrobiae bacterium]